jgi:crotonobetainyl-CoA:carnitine CoA-transferase CaiB-like acyl-CoA transferase
MQRLELLDDSRFASRETRHANRDAMLAVFQEFASTFTRFDDFEAALGTARLAVGEMKPLRAVADAEWAREREALVDVGDEGESLRLPRSPFRFSNATAGTSGRPAWLGQHNREVLREVLGLTDDAIDQLERDAVLIARRPPV